MFEIQNLLAQRSDLRVIVYEFSLDCESNVFGFLQSTDA